MLKKFLLIIRGNQINGEFGIGSAGLVISDTVKIDPNIEIVSCGPLNGYLLSATGDAYKLIGDYTDSYLEKVPSSIKFKNLAEQRRGTPLLLGVDGNLYTITARRVYNIPTEFETKFINSKAIVSTTNDVYTYEYTTKHVFTLKLNASAILGNVSIEYINAAPQNYANYGIILSNGTLMVWGINACK